MTIIAALVALALVPSTAFAAKKKPTFKITTSNVSLSEGGGSATVTVTRQGDRNPHVTVDYTTIDKPAAGAGTADPNSDYTPASGTLDFAANQTSKTFTIPVIDDQVSDPNETVKFKLQNPVNITSGSQGAALGNPNTGTLTIVDNDGAGTIDFSSPTYTVLESGAFATITVNRQSATNISETVHYATSNGSTNPATAGSDYTATSGTLTFPVGVMSATFQVPIIDDSNFEGPETVTLTLSSPTSPLGTPALGPNNATPTVLTINDDDVPIFKFSSANYSVNEDHPGQATITVNRTGATNIAADVNYATSDGSATAGPSGVLNGTSDYTATSGTLHFNAGQTQNTFNVPIIDDTAAEANELLNLTLTVNGNPVDTSQLSIVDDDNPLASVQFSSASYSVGESDGTATVTVTLGKPVDGDVTVHYATADGATNGATAGSDYTAASGTLTFLGNNSMGGPGLGQTSQTFTVPILDDPDFEGDETVQLTLSSQTNSVLGDPSTSTLTIVDDDPPGSFQFSGFAYNVNETGGQATITVRRVGGVGGAVSVDYATSDGSATAGSDYTASSGTLNFAQGETQKTFVVPVAWDGQGEGPETVNLGLSNPGGGADIVAGSDAAVLTIADDGASGPVQFSTSGYNVNEGDGTATITVTRSGGSLGGPVSVDYATSDGSATAGSDYGATSGTLTFGPGETSKSFQVPIINDSAHEDTETIRLTLSNPAGGTSLGSPTSAVVMIADDDAAPAATSDQSGTGTQSTPANPNPAGSQTAAKDTTAPKLTLAAKRLQKAVKAKLLALTARCNENCKVVVTAKLGTGRKAVTLGKASARTAAGKAARLKIKLSKKALAKLEKAMKHGKVAVTVGAVASDAAGNKRASSRKIVVIG